MLCQYQYCTVPYDSLLTLVRERARQIGDLVYMVASACSSRKFRFKFDERSRYNLLLLNYMDISIP